MLTSPPRVPPSPAFSRSGGRLGPGDPVIAALLELNLQRRVGGAVGFIAFSVSLDRFLARLQEHRLGFGARPSQRPRKLTSRERAISGASHRTSCMDGWVNRSAVSPGRRETCQPSGPAREVFVSRPPGPGSSPGGCLVSARSETLVMQV